MKHRRQKTFINERRGILFLFSIVLLMIFSVNLANAQIQVINAKQGDCVNLLQTCADCTYNVITSIIYPNNSQALGQVSMQKINTQYNYTFCDTNTLGCDTTGNPYIINGFGDAGGTDTTWNYKLCITNSGRNVTGPQVTLIIIGLVVMLIVVAFFFILSLLFKHPGTKLFLMALSSLTLIVLIGIITSNASTYLAEYPNLVSMYNQYYTLIVILAGTAMAGILIWLVYYSVMLFNKSRGRTSDDD